MPAGQIFIEYLFVVVLGLVLGSFSTALVFRSPRGISWTGAARSACPHCNAVLKARDLVPLFSWIFLRGRCRACGQKISAEYPLTELASVLACLGIYWSFGLSFHAFLLFACIPFLLALLVVDIQHMILPDLLVTCLGGLGLLNLAGEIIFSNPVTFPGGALDSIAGAFGYGFLAWGLGWIMEKVLKKEALGFGDVKFFIVAGLWLGLSHLGLFCILSGLLGVLVAIIWKIAKKGPVFPFGPALILSLYFLLIF
ncbi:MAG: prepilin peptidase [Alphaproteobacteria bacterium]|nr:prepilin peptidase [Alphaproteobacteria bacterium]